MIMANVSFKLDIKPKRNYKIVGFWSAKGGVGKTTISINIAYELSKKYNVGLLDADINCPNVVEYLNLKDELVGSKEENKIYPIIKDNLQIVSMGAIYKDVIMWRGPLLSKAIKELLGRTDWRNIKYLIVDLPPGTGDIPITIMNEIKPDGVFLITTPSKLAKQDVRKSKQFLDKFSIKYLGLIGNMCGNVFGSIEEKHIGCLELSPDIHRSIEKGEFIDSDIFKRAVEIIEEI